MLIHHLVLFLGELPLCIISIFSSCAFRPWLSKLFFSCAWRCLYRFDILGQTVIISSSIHLLNCSLGNNTFFISPSSKISAFHVRALHSNLLMFFVTQVAARPHQWPFSWPCLSIALTAVSLLLSRSFRFVIIACLCWFGGFRPGGATPPSCEHLA